ncbi:hypothetical protein [Streptomyces sp. NPDC059783]|uniref:D-alanine--D-alanine ligase family protein n=1 Tax=Streptomyces sp. NPDC059783 TaxID=3346944 RepID=UPI003666E743
MMLLTPQPGQRVAVVTGGWSRERDRSLATAKAVMRVLDVLGIPATSFDLADGLAALPGIGGFDAAFLAVSGRGAEDGQLQGVLETLGIPYTGSGVLASALGTHKLAAKAILRATGVLSPADCTVSTTATAREEAAEILDSFGLPLIVKEISAGGSGLLLARDEDELVHAIEASDGAPLMVEEYIPGTPAVVGVLDAVDGPAALSPLEVETPTGRYTHESKQLPGQITYHCPPRWSKTTREEVQEAAKVAHTALGCRGYSRHDFVIDRYGTAFWLGVSTLPDLTQRGDIARMAAADGITYPDLITHILASASIDRPTTTTRSAA